MRKTASQIADEVLEKCSVWYNPGDWNLFGARDARRKAAIKQSRIDHEALKARAAELNIDMDAVKNIDWDIRREHELRGPSPAGKHYWYEDQLPEGGFPDSPSVADYDNLMKSYMKSPSMRHGLLSKTGGYWQNVVGFDDADLYTKQRQQVMDAARASEGLSPSDGDPYWDAETQSLEAMENFTPESFGGKDLGELRKYQYVTPMVGNPEPAGLESSGKGYMTRDEIKAYLGSDYDTVPEETRTALEASPHKYYASTRAG
jgi:hypothetical protein